MLLPGLDWKGLRPRPPPWEFLACHFPRLWHEGPHQVALCAYPPAHGSWEVRVTRILPSLGRRTTPTPAATLLPLSHRACFSGESTACGFPLPFGSGPMSIWCHQDEEPAFGQGPSVQAFTVGQRPLHPWTRLQCSVRWAQTVCCTAWSGSGHVCHLQQLLGFRVMPCPHPPPPGPLAAPGHVSRAGLGVDTGEGGDASTGADLG